jgi:hypothetical protein
MSIRDQMFRGYIIVKRALDAGVISPGQVSPILIVGAGIAGTMASVVAIENGVKVWLVESQLPLVRQSESRRVICPTQYDWPAAHWSRGEYPWIGATMPFSWTRDSSSAGALRWISQLNLAKELYSDLLRVETGRKFLKCEVLDDKDNIRAHFEPDLSDAPLFSMVIACTGFGLERTQIPKIDPIYTGYRFWELDPYDQPNLGLAEEDNPRILISGAGDGSLQDFLRFATGKIAGDIYQALPDEAKPLIEEQIFKLEDYALRSLVWGDIGVLDHPIHRDLQLAHQRIVDNLLEVSKFSSKVKKALRSLTEPLNDRVIKLVFPCDHFSSCYSLNRFLVLLISTYLQKANSIVTLHPRTKVLDVKPINHSCLNSPKLCHGEMHEVVGAEATCQTFYTAGAAPGDRFEIPGGPFNVLIVRHGVKSDSPPLGSAPAATPYRQMVPYYSPW